MYDRSRCSLARTDERGDSAEEAPPPCPPCICPDRSMRARAAAAVAGDRLIKSSVDVRSRRPPAGGEVALDAGVAGDARDAAGEAGEDDEGGEGGEDGEDGDPLASGEPLAAKEVRRRLERGESGGMPRGLGGGLGEEDRLIKSSVEVLSRRPPAFGEATVGERGGGFGAAAARAGGPAEAVVAAGEAGGLLGGVPGDFGVEDLGEDAFCFRREDKRRRRDLVGEGDVSWLAPPLVDFGEPVGGGGGAPAGGGGLSMRGGPISRRTEP